MIFNYRCSQEGCRKRVTLTHLLEWYIRPPKCKGACLGTGNLKRDPEVSRRHRRENCYCSGVRWTPHRRGTILNEYEICDHVPHEDLERALFRRSGVELDGPASYLFGLDQPPIYEPETPRGP